MRTITPILLCLFTLALSARAQSKPADVEPIDEYEFNWTVATSGDAKLIVHKDQESTSIRIQQKYDSLTLKPAVAAKLATVLQTTDKHYAKMRGATEDANESVPAGDCNVVFNQNAKFGFSVSIRDKGFVGTSVMIDRKAAKAFAPVLARSIELAKRADRVVDAAVSAK